VGIIDNIPFLPFFGPFADRENLHFVFGCGADHSPEAGVDNHFLTYKTGVSIYGFLFLVIATIDIYIASQKTDSSSSGINDGILLSMDTSAKFVAMSVRDVELIPETGAVFKTALGFSRRSNVACRDDLVIADDDRSDRASETGASPGDFLGNS
jgi:hypothetical protein